MSISTEEVKGTNNSCQEKCRCSPARGLHQGRDRQADDQHSGQRRQVRPHLSRRAADRAPFVHCQMDQGGKQGSPYRRMLSLPCHERILNELVGEDRLVVFDTLSHYQKYTDLFDIEDMPEEERKQVVRVVANGVLEQIDKNSPR